jgi:F0F1-type ATP synthase delta subunit/F0F1-type ATP synthase membrane subunit b/b'
MSTFLGQLAGFALIVLLVVRYAVPPVRAMMKRHQDAVRNALDESASAARKLASADDMHAKALEDAKAETARLAEVARHDSALISEQSRDQAATEAERIKALGAKQVNQMHLHAIREAKATLGAESVRRAEELVRVHVAEPGAQSATVDRFLGELAAMSPSTPVAVGATLRLGSFSRDALAVTVKRFDDLARDPDSAALTRLADDLTQIVGLLHREPSLVRALGRPVPDSSGKVQLLRTLFEGKVGAGAFTILIAAGGERWSNGTDLVEGLEHVARLARLTRANESGEGERLEEGIFDFGRVLDGNPRLTTLLSDFNAPAAGRLGLLDTVLGRIGVSGTAVDLLRQTVQLINGERLDEVVHDLVELAVARRGELVALVTAPAALTQAQGARLSEVLSRIYGHPVTPHIDVDPELLGGLVINIGGEVIDGTLSSRLAAARTGLPD